MAGGEPANFLDVGEGRCQKGRRSFQDYLEVLK